MLSLIHRDGAKSKMSNRTTWMTLFLLGIVVFGRDDIWIARPNFKGVLFHTNTLWTGHITNFLRCFRICYSDLRTQTVFYSSNTMICQCNGAKYDTHVSPSLGALAFQDGQQNKNISCPEKHVFTSGPFYVNLTFRIVFDDPVYQAMAKSRCKEHGASLVIIDTVEKQTYLRYILLKCPEYGVHDYWIDGYDEDGDNKSWKYSDGKNMTMNNVIFWASYAPTDVSERCVRMRKLDDYFWNDQNCLFHFGYICEKAK